MGHVTGKLHASIACSFLHNREEVILHDGRPDGDNLIKPIFDAIKNNVIDGDDCKIVSHFCIKIKSSYAFVAVNLYEIGEELWKKNLLAMN
jgi:Holliday junction resolvase RusA-like endonuclease